MNYFFPVLILTFITMSAFGKIKSRTTTTTTTSTETNKANGKASSSSSSSTFDGVKQFLPEGAYRKVAAGEGCEEGFLSWRDGTMVFGKGSKAMVFHSFGNESETPPALDNCKAKTKTHMKRSSNGKTDRLTLSEKITQENCGPKLRVIEHELIAVKHHKKMELTISTSDTGNLKQTVCKYEKSL